VTALSVLTGTAHPALGDAVAAVLGVPLANRTIERFPDGEMQVELGTAVAGHDVFLLQPTGTPVAEHLLELLMLADAAHRGGARRVNAVIPYLGYARQDRRKHRGEALGGRLVADMLGASSIERVLAVDLHTPALEGFFRMPLEHETAVPYLAAGLREATAGSAVVVAPDLGAVRLAERYGSLLGLPFATVLKARISGSEVETSGVVGDVRGRSAVIVDDMISTGATIQAAAQAVLEAGSMPPVLVAATHGLFVGPAAERLRTAAPAKVLVTDSLPAVPLTGVPVEAISIAPLLADRIRLIHEEWRAA
jgi:ribose-phosphate pyrophosphokinase